MKIEFFHGEENKFLCIAEGDCFVYNRDVYMRVEPGKSEEGDKFNAISLSRGELRLFDPSKDKVLLIKAKLVIE